MAIYYALMTPLLVVLIENSIILSELAQAPQIWQIGLAALGLAFLPRVVSYASSIERARNTIIAILTPLTLMALALIVVNPARIVFHQEPFELAFLGILPLLAIGDSALYLSATIGVTKPPISLEMIARSDIECTIRTQLVTYPYDTLIVVLGEAKKRKRRETQNAIVESLLFALDLAVKEKTPRARAAIARGITQSIPAYANLTDTLLLIIEGLSYDESPDVIKEISGCYGCVLERAPDKCIGILASLARHPSPQVRRVVIDFCWRRLATGPPILRSIFVDTMEEFLRRIRHALGNLMFDVSHRFERRIMLEERIEETKRHAFDIALPPRLSGEESVFSESDFLKLLHKAWEIDANRMDNALAEMVHSRHLSARYGAVMILTEQSLRDRVADNRNLIESLKLDKSAFIRTIAKNFLGSNLKHRISPDMVRVMQLPF